MGLKILLALHYRLTPGGGAPGATLALGSALSDLGCNVDFFGLEQAFGHDIEDSIGTNLKFPWRLKSFLRRRASQFDVLEVSAGDAWVWAMSDRRHGSQLPALITRSYLLEQTYDQNLRSMAEQGKLKLSFKYPIYHGGFRLWEVRQSIVRSDQTLVANELDRDYVVDVMNVAPVQVSVISSGLRGQFVGLPSPAWIPHDQLEPLRIVMLGPWSDQQGKQVIIQAALQLHRDQIPFLLTLKGTEYDEVEVRADFPPSLRPLVRVVPDYRQAELPSLLMHQQIVLMCGVCEPYPMALTETMACGLAPIVTPLGGASRAILQSSNGEVLSAADPLAITRIISRWSNDRCQLHAIRQRAHQIAQRQDWNQIAARTIRVYEQVLKRIAGSAAPTCVPSVSLAPAPRLWQRDGKPALSIGICTANQPAMLRRCLASIEQGESLPAEVVVGDDSLDGAQTLAVCSEFSFVRYVRGPRRGICANRNVVIAATLGEYLSLLDDDAEVTPEFVRTAQNLASLADGRTVFTGDVMENGFDRVPPTNPTFWGHYGRPLSEVGGCETVQLNSNLFPKTAFKDARFDEHIVFGYEEMDLCQQMLSDGFRIEYRRELLSLHLPPPRSKAVELFPGLHVERARYYTSLKRYMMWQSRPVRACAYAALAPLHQAAHYILRKQIRRALAGFGDMTWAFRQALASRKAARALESGPVSRREMPPAVPKYYA